MRYVYGPIHIKCPNQNFWKNQNLIYDISQNPKIYWKFIHDLKSQQNQNTAILVFQLQVPSHATPP